MAFKICPKHGQYGKEKWGETHCPKCWEEHLAEFNTTLTELKKKTKSATTDQILALADANDIPYDEYVGQYGIVRKFRAADVERLVELWRTSPEYAAAEQARLEAQRKKSAEYRRWRRARKDVAFFCEKCDEMVEGRADSSAVISYMDGEIDKDECIELIRRAHYRHEHTDYDTERLKRYERYRELGFSWEDAHYEARIEARKKNEVV